MIPLTLKEISYVIVHCIKPDGNTASLSNATQAKNYDLADTFIQSKSLLLNTLILLR